MSRLDDLARETAALFRRRDAGTISAEDYCRRLNEIAKEYVALLGPQLKPAIPPRMEAVAK